MWFSPPYAVEVYLSLPGNKGTRMSNKNAPLEIYREEPGKNHEKLEVELDTQLDTARCATADEWIADAHVAGSRYDATASPTRIAHFATVHHLGTVN